MIGNPAFQIIMTSQKDDIAKMLHDIRKDDLRFENLNFEIFLHDKKNIGHYVVKSAKNFAKSFFSDVSKFRSQFSQIRGIVKHGLNTF